MVAHQTAGDQSYIRLLLKAGETVDQVLSVLVIIEQILPVDPAQQDMIVTAAAFFRAVRGISSPPTAA